MTSLILLRYALVLIRRFFTIFTTHSRYNKRFTLVMALLHDVNGPCMCVRCGCHLPVKLAKGGNSPGHHYIHVSDELNHRLHVS